MARKMITMRLHEELIVAIDRTRTAWQKPGERKKTRRYLIESLLIPAFQRELPPNLTADTTFYGEKEDEE